MLLFLALVMCVSFTSFWRRTFLVCAMGYFFKNGEFAPFLFFSGALLAEISLVLSSSQQQIKPTIDDRDVCPPWVGRAKKHWPTALAILGIFIGSFPPENAHRAAYSRIMWNFFTRYITPEGCIFPLLFYLTYRRSYAFYRWLWCHLSHYWNLILAEYSSFPIESDICLSREYLIPALSLTRNIHPSSSRMGLFRCPSPSSFPQHSGIYRGLKR